jgi:DNA-binding MarR family transcriptional regulator
MVMPDAAPDTPQDADATAIRLTLALTRLRARLREEASAPSAGLPISQLSILQRLRLHGPATAASLATAEHVSQQAIAQSVARLRSAGLVRSEPDPSDRRKTLIGITEAGLALRASIVASRTSWLARAIDSTVDDADALDVAVDLLERLADAHP